MNRVVALVVAVLAAAALLESSARAEDKKPAPAPVMGEKKPEAPAAGKPGAGESKAGEEAAQGGMDAEMMKKWMEAATPGPHHKHLEQLVGKWICKSELVMSPGLPAQVSEGKAEFKFIMDGRFLQQEFTGACFDPNGPPMTGIGLTGYNNLARRYEAIWMDSGSTGMAMMTGSCSDDGRSFTFTGEYADPMSDGKMKKFRTLGKIIDKDTHTFEFFEPGPDGKEFRSMLITYTRAR